MEWIEKIRLYLVDPRNKQKIKLASLVTVFIIGMAIIITQQRKTSALAKVVTVDTTAAALERAVARIDLDVPYYNKKVRYKTATFYRKNKGEAKWLAKGKPTKSYEAFLNAVRNSATFGLNPDHYDMRVIRENVSKLYEKADIRDSEIANLDIRITASFFLFTTHMIEGRIRTIGNNNFIWKRPVNDENDINLLLENTADKLEESLIGLHPDNEQYRKLHEALNYYRRLDDPSVGTLTSNNVVIKPGVNHALIPEIRRRLMLTDLEPYPVNVGSVYYDEQLLEGVKKFQHRHGLAADGVITDATLKYMNQSFKEKAALIELNLERLRWLPRETSEDYIAVNVPEYTLRVYNNNEKKLEMRVVLGSEYNATPIFVDTLEYLVFSPTWNIPPGILEEEAIPNLITNPDHYDKERFKIYKKGKLIDPEDEDWTDEDLDPRDYQIVENPGPDNSLGLVKFIMPNNFNVYLHDTPAEHLFSKRKRAYSHGCIRLEEPDLLAKYLLRDQPDWNGETIKKAMSGVEPVTVNLKKQYPVMIEYHTVWVDEKGLLHFREDVYGHDKRQLAQLNRLR